MEVVISNNVLTNKEVNQLKKWINVLKTTKKKQTQADLQNENGYCCLGIACEALIPKKKLSYEYKFGKSKGKKFIAGGMPAMQQHAPEWLKDINSDFQRTNDSLHPVGLINLNDAAGDKQWSFKEIARALEATYLKSATKSDFDSLLRINLKRETFSKIK